MTMSDSSWLRQALDFTRWSDEQSALNPAGSGAVAIERLSMALFASGAAIFVIVMALVAAALWGGPGLRSLLANRLSIWVGGVAFPVVVLTGLLASSAMMMRAFATTDPEMTIEVVGEQWWWRIAYRGKDGAGFAEANEIRIPVGRKVRFLLSSSDVIHSFWVPSLAGKLDMIPGRINALTLRAERPGVYSGQCAEYCGGPHALMAFDVVAMAADEFDAWVAGGSAPSRGAPDEIENQGAAIFLAAGCGGCHTVRGTRARGEAGPDLSRVGGRRSIAAGALPNNPSSLARFISDGQHVKPENRMPPFKIFSAAELSALAAYLSGLK